MTILYIGQYTDGTTSKMRANQLCEILNPKGFQIIDTHNPFFKTKKIFRSFGFRYKRGPLIKRTNEYILNQLNTSAVNSFDLIWVDKAVYITRKTTALLKQKTKLLIHFTPDPAFTFHQSRHFKSSLNLYDFVISTKSYEKSHYLRSIPKNSFILTTQGYNHETHYPIFDFMEKKEGVLFIGHCEDQREKILQELINSGIKVSVAGIKWNRFVKRNNNNSFLTYLGNGIYGPEYAKTLSLYQFSWGALSKWVPELHTTRTFEIPACGTALITERNVETCRYFNEDEAIFYDSTTELIEKIRYFQNHLDELKKVTRKGRKRVVNDGRDYKSILKQVLIEVSFDNSALSSNL